MDAIHGALKSVRLVPAGSAAAVLGLLRSGAVDSVLIGRTAKTAELADDTKFERLREGLTLVYREKTVVHEELVTRIREMVS